MRGREYEQMAVAIDRGVTRGNHEERGFRLRKLSNILHEAVNST